MKRKYRMEPNQVRYIKERPFKNHSKVHTRENTYGGFVCRSKLVMRVLGWMWKRFGVRVIR